MPVSVADVPEPEIVAIEVLPLNHVPPLVAQLNVVDAPSQVTPPPAIATGEGLTTIDVVVGFEAIPPDDTTHV